MTSHLNPDPNLHPSYIRDQIRIFSLVAERMYREGRDSEANALEVEISLVRGPLNSELAKKYGFNYYPQKDMDVFIKPLPEEIFADTKTKNEIMCFAAAPMNLKVLDDFGIVIKHSYLP